MLNVFKENTEDNYKQLHSEIIMFYQIIDRDIKTIYWSMLKDDEDKPKWSKVKKWPFGKIVNDLQLLDHLNNEPLISIKDYKYLKTVVVKRNHWAHGNFIEFIYKDNPFDTNEFNTSYDKLLVDYGEAKRIYQELERTRLIFIKR